MKKTLLLITVLALAFALSGCVTQVTKESKPSLSASEASVSSAAQSQSQSASAVNWTLAASADIAAKDAGISSFGVPERTVIADFVFAHPEYAYNEHIAQATYEVPGSAKLIVRKAEGAHSVPVTDRGQSDFSQTWKNNYEGYEVTSCGDTQGAATICFWNDGTKEYGVTIEGLGGSKVTMDSTDVDDIVTAIKAAENPQETSTQQTTQSSASSSTSNAPSFNVESFVWNNGLGEFNRYYYVQGSDGKGYWAIVTRGADGGEYTSYADTQGNIIQGGVDTGSAPQASYDGADFSVEGLVQANGLGQFKRYYWIQGENGVGYWGIVTIAADGTEQTTYTDEQGNIIQGGVETGSVANTTNDGADFSVEAFAQQYNLGQFEHYYWVQGADGKGYWAIVTRGEDGAEYTTYSDEQGNVIQGGL